MGPLMCDQVMPVNSKSPLLGGSMGVDVADRIKIEILHLLGWDGAQRSLAMVGIKFPTSAQPLCTERGRGSREKFATVPLRT